MGGKRMRKFWFSSCTIDKMWLEEDSEGEPRKNYGSETFRSFPKFSWDELISDVFNPTYSQKTLQGTIITKFNSFLKNLTLVRSFFGQHHQPDFTIKAPKNV